MQICFCLRVRIQVGSLPKKLGFFCAPQLSWGAILMFSTQKLHGVCHFLRLTENQTPGPSDCIQREDKWTDLQNSLFHPHCQSTANSQGVLRLHLQTPHGNTWPGNFVVQNVPLEAVLLDRSRVSSCSIYFGISISWGGLVPTFLTSRCVFVGSLPTILPCWSILGRVAVVLSYGGAFQRGTAVCPELRWRVGKEGCWSCLCHGLSPVSWYQGQQSLHSRRFPGIIIW